MYSLYLDRIWLSTEKIGITKKIKSIPSKYFALLFGLASIKYLGRKFYYDNANTAATLQTYPSEILRIAEHIDLGEAIILDIGANIGQFSVTLKALIPHAVIYAFEANNEIFDIFRANIGNIPNIDIFNIAIGSGNSLPFYYVSGHSDKGSLRKENAEINLGGKRANKISIHTKTFSKEFRRQRDIPNKFDLVKIDVEGGEIEVLDALKDISARALYIEFSNQRSCGYEFKELLDKIENTLGIFRVVYCDEITPDTTMGNMLLAFV